MNWNESILNRLVSQRSAESIGKHKPFRAWAALLSAAVMATSSIPAVAADYSNWLKNISASGDPEALYNHMNAKVAVSGPYVHLAWYAAKKSGNEVNALFYTRSTNGGITFENPRILAVGPKLFEAVRFPATSNNLAADGACVHIVYIAANATPVPSAVQYLRSTDNGATFAAAKTLVSGTVTGFTGCITAANGKLAITWSLEGNMPWDPRSVNCTYSSDNGATFKTTLVAYTEGDAKPGTPYEYEVLDAVRSGDYLYILTLTVYNGSYPSWSRIHLWSSWDGGATFKAPVQVTLTSVDGLDHATTTQAGHYSPNLVASGLVANITWVNIDDHGGSYYGVNASSLRTRRTTDGGLTLGAPVTLHSFPAGLSGGSPGLETIAGSGNNLYITSVLDHAPKGTYLWRSTDAGTTWKPTKQISTGGWWPLTKVDPSNPNVIHTVNGSYFQSTNSGASFDGGVNPHTYISDWQTAQMAVDASGVVHYAANSGGQWDGEIFYRRIAPAPAPGATDKALTLVCDGTRVDNMQVAAVPGLNFTTAMTLEFWARRDTDVISGFSQPMVGKKRIYGDGSYGIGAWDGAQVYARLVTDKSANSYYGDWIGSGVSMEKGKWYHLALTYDASLAADNIKLFVNGVLYGKANLQGSILTDTMDSPLQIGNKTSNPGGFSIDELRIWNRPLSQTSIMDGLSRSLKGTEGGLVAYYNFNGTTKDITGHGHDGTLMFRERFTKPGPMTLLKPEIGVQQPIGSKLVDGTSKRSFGTVKTGKIGTAKTFTIKNSGTVTLTGLAITKNGAHASNFIVTQPTKTKLAPGTSTTFKVSFKPSAPGTRTAAIHIKNNDSNENPFDIQLTGLGVKP